MHGTDDHDRGLAFDLQTLERQLLARRRMLGMMAMGGGALLLNACGGSGDSGSSAATTTTTTTTTGTGTTGTGTTGTGSTACAATPTETNGPYPADGSNMANGVLSNILNTSGVVRSDIRGSFGGLSGTAAGVPLTLTVNLVNTNASCAALADYAIYAWHCDANGLYSLYDLPQQNYLRGVQATNASGQATFTTIFPGCYAGRYPHIHFEVYRSLSAATNYANRLLVSQFAMPAAACTAVYAAGGYPNSASRFAQTNTSSDNVFGDNTAAQIAAMTPALSGSPSAGYTGAVTVGLAV
ncbi:MAG: intradiol ring-cleavage dioxygenase [Alphaproteobacteria bacterium]|nr:intradiol ring-cleavage dioxygenase [Alphaproteobacteria bacterium]MBU1513157.1 intradiol ring-cleavage dioxygenase [Alphaproteobacteria bacterium]MBU2095265.1 intradiol ring-cleavage dioxygenase [Alphaproteobacteria bacterium]MBU2152180.1 intradiol ring-cleavage dioxygenase [Alphaproteobacteria bacterium]MBU2306773.1 intradiol ring-cleavage dioxygenase [Alphaproteobacteria bacterium]